MSRIIAYPGTEGSFSYSAARQAFPWETFAGHETFEECAQAVVDGRADYALLPIENSFAGAVLATYRILEKQPLHIVGEVRRKVRHMLLGLPDACLEDVRVISSHPQAIAQCDTFLAGLRHVQILPGLNTALCAREVQQTGDRTRAAIASAEAAEVFGLKVLAENIQSSDHNTTRFFVVSRKDAPLGDPEKATVVFRVNNEVGALARLLTCFASHGLNMTRIESRPIPDEPFLYFFSSDFEGNMDLAELRRALREAEAFTSELRLLGVYPKAGEVR